MRRPPRLHPAEPASHQRERVIKPGNPRHEVIIGQHEPDKYRKPDHKMLLSYWYSSRRSLCVLVAG
jgi:hypothetical protein